MSELAQKIYEYSTNDEIEAIKNDVKKFTDMARNFKKAYDSFLPLKQQYENDLKLLVQHWSNLKKSGVT